MQYHIGAVAYPVCCTISNVFLILTFAVYLILPELYSPLFGKVVLAFIVSLFAAYLTLTIAYFGGIKLIRGNETGCKFLGFLIQVQEVK